jgi:hypothetical protein
MMVFTGPYMHILLVHIAIQIKMGLITKSYALGYCWTASTDNILLIANHAPNVSNLLTNLFIADLLGYLLH